MTGPDSEGLQAGYLDSEFAAEALATIVLYGMDNDRPPAEVAANVLAHLKMHLPSSPVVPSVAAVPVEVPELPSFSHSDSCDRYYADEADPTIACTCGADKAQAWLDRLVAEREAIIEVLSEFAPLALPHNDLPTIVRGIALQRDNQHELKDHLAEVARKLADERDRVRAEERQRIAAMLDMESQRAADLAAEATDGSGRQWTLDNRCVSFQSAARMVAAGSAVPVATPPTFDDLLTDPKEQFDTRSELLPALVRHLGLPPTADVEPLLRSIEEYRNAPPAGFTVPSVATPTANPDPRPDALARYLTATLGYPVSPRSALVESAVAALDDAEQDGQR